MSKAILMSIRPQYVAKILNGEKTIEMRKKFPKDYVGWVYIYCTKNQGRYGENQIVRNIKTKEYSLWADLESYDANAIRSGYNGLVLARFWCNKVEHFEFETISRDIDGYWWDNGKMVEHSFITKQCCLTTESFTKYIEYGGGYAIHISKLEVFDKPKELKDFYKVGAWKVFEEQFDSSYLKREQQEIMEELEQTITKAPQSWCYIEGE